METAAPNAPAKATGIVSGSLSLLHLRAALVCAGKKDIRHYLNGLQFELHPEAPAVLTIATDGHRIIVCRNLGAGLTGKAPARFFLEHDQAAQIITAFKRSTLPNVFFTLDQDKAMVEITGAGNARFAFPSNADTANSFPNWRLILAHLKPSGEIAQFNPDYLCDCARIANMVSREPIIHCEHNGDGVARITFGDDNIVMGLMPVRIYSPIETDWLGEIAAPATWSRA